MWKNKINHSNDMNNFKVIKVAVIGTGHFGLNIVALFFVVKNKYKF